MTTKKPTKKPTMTTKKASNKKHVKKPTKKAATKKGLTKKGSAKLRSVGSADGLLARVVAAEKTTRTLCELLTKTCKYALDAADIIADERLVEAEEDHNFRDEIDAIRATAGISLPERKPKSRLDIASDEYVWIADEERDEKTPAKLGRETLATPKGEEPVVQRADHGGGMSGHDDDDDNDDEVGTLVAPDDDDVALVQSVPDSAAHSLSETNGAIKHSAEDDAPIQ